MKFILFISILSILLCCKSVEQSKNDPTILKSISSNFDSWHHKDLILDSIPGISLEKWYNENKSLKPKNEIIVAVLDTQIDINHENLQGQLWVNRKEIQNNNIDDDSNGYIDDVNGWNFLGHFDEKYSRYGKFEYSRIIQFKNDYLKLNINQYNDSVVLIKELSRAGNLQNKTLKSYNNWKKSLDFLDNNWEKVEDTINFFLKNKTYNIKQIDSLYKLYKINDKTFKERRNDNDLDLGALINYKLISLEFEYNTYEKLLEEKKQIDSIININLNINFNDRKWINEKPNTLEKGYGNNRLNENQFHLGHSTAISGIIASDIYNKKGVRGFHQKIKIMPLCISQSGDEHDKDIAMAIYYAVDNGAKIINMSFGKGFSFHQKWVTEALKYAEKHNVLLIHSSGNNSINLDTDPYYPMDVDYLKNDKIEIVNNFINVGSISNKKDSSIVSSFSNYGNQNVDIFAPGDEIYSCAPNNKYEFYSGTSFAAPMVTGTAALIWLYYPNLSVQQVKQIILESGVTIDKKVINPGTKDELVSFSELCKSGKILNTYNAMEMAKKMSKKKK